MSVHCFTLFTTTEMLAVLCWTALMSTAFGQDKKGWKLTPPDSNSTPRVGFFYHPFASTVHGNYKLGCEIPLGKSWTTRATLAVGFPSDSRYFEVYDRRSVGLEGQLRYYIFSHQWRGLYGSVFGYAKYMAFNTLPNGGFTLLLGPIQSLNQYPYYPDSYNRAEASALTIGPAVGYHYAVDANFVFDTYLGLGFQSASITGSGTVRMKADHPMRSRTFESYRQGVALHCGISIGFLLY
jgi:hypothetical protein